MRISKKRFMVFQNELSELLNIIDNDEEIFELCRSFVNELDEGNFNVPENLYLLIKNSYEYCELYFNFDHNTQYQEIANTLLNTYPDEDDYREKVHHVADSQTQEIYENIESKYIENINKIIRYIY